MRNKPLPVFFVLRMPLGRLVLSLLLAPCPVILPSSGAVRSSLPALLSAYYGVGRDGTRSLSRYRLLVLPSFACLFGWGSSACVSLSVPACLLGRWICVCSDCGGLSAYSVGGAIYVGNVLAKLYI